jgi:two-component system, LytTR family, response regulator
LCATAIAAGSYALRIFPGWNPRTITGLHFGGNAALIFRSPTAIDQLVSPTTFFRENRSPIVNLSWSEAAENDVDGRLSIKLRNGTQIEILRRQSRSLKDPLIL